MNRRVFLVSSAGALLLATGASAAPPEEQIARSLRGEGFQITSQRRTFLGRVRFKAVRGNAEREVVVDPASGEILRDYTYTAEASSGEAGSAGGTASSADGGGGGAHGGETHGETGGGDAPSAEPTRDGGHTGTANSETPK